MAKAKKRVLYCKDIGIKMERDSREYYVSEYNELMKKREENGKVPRGKIREKMAELGAWSEELEAMQKQYEKELDEALGKLNAGGVPLTEAKALAIDAQIARLRINMITNSISEYDSLWSFESAAEEKKNIYLIVNCVFYKDDDSPVFNSLEEFDACEDEDLISQCVKVLNKTLYGTNDDYYSSLPETKFLMDYGFMDEDYNIINEESEEKEFKPFLDAEGNPVEPKVTKE